MSRALLVLLALSLGACRDDDRYEGAFDLPTAAAVLQPELAGPFEEPVGFVANGIGGQITPLALKQGRMLTDDRVAAFQRTNPLPTGAARLLSGIAVYAPADDQIDLFVGDRTYSQLLRVPYVDGLDDDGFPVEVEPTLGEVRFVDADGSGDSPSLVNVEIKPGYTSTEDWTVTWDGRRWNVEGSRSGRAEAGVRSGERFIGRKRNIALTPKGSASAGDHFTFSTDSGIEEIDVGGIPLAVTITPDQSRLALVVHDEDTDAAVVRWVHPDRLEVLGDAPLDAGASPWRFAWSEDGTRLFVSDTALPAAWEIELGASVARDTVTRHSLPFPSLDVAQLTHADTGQRVLFVAAADRPEVWRLDLDASGADRFLDVNPYVEGVQGQVFRSAVRGLEAMPVPYQFDERDADGVRRWGRSVAISLSSGRVVFMKEENGCLVSDQLGPRSEAQSQFGNVDYETNFELPGVSFLEPNQDNNRHVQVAACGGIARSETWTLRYRVDEGGWEVRGSISGEQSQLAFEDQRYTSDSGAISFVMRSGVFPSRDDYTLVFNTLEGITSADGVDANLENAVRIDAPSDPVYFQYLVGPSDKGWKTIDRRPFVLVGAEGGDIVTRIKPQDGTVDVTWR